MARDGWEEDWPSRATSLAGSDAVASPDRLDCVGLQSPSIRL